jgi:hypothetical protein
MSKAREQRTARGIVATCVVALLVTLNACNDTSSGGGVSGGSGSDAAIAADGHAVCADLCWEAYKLQCPLDQGDGCEIECFGYWDDPPDPPDCRAQVRAVLTCTANVPSSGWECDQDEEANIKASYCRQEIVALNACTHQ